MIKLLERAFTVDVPLPCAWDHLARIAEWPSWARHITKIDLMPPGELGPQSTGVIHLANGMQSAFRMTEFDLPRNWKWVGPILWLTIAYDHQFEAIDSEHTRLTWIVQAEGFGARIFGRLFAALYRRNMDRAIALLTREMNSLPSGVGRDSGGWEAK